MQPQVQEQTGVAAGASARESGLDRLARGGEDGEDAVAEELAFDGDARVFADGRAEGGVEVAGFRAEGRVAEALGEGCGVRDIGEEDDRGAGRERGGGGFSLTRLADEFRDEARDR